jgi:hypothetical protein
MNKTELIDKLLHLGNTTEMCSSTDRHNAKELAHTLIDEYLEAINYTHCCKSDSELLVCDDNELDCPYEFTSRCTMGRCGCKPKAN